MAGDKQSVIQRKLEDLAPSREVRQALLELFFFEQDEADKSQYKRAYTSILERYSGVSQGAVSE